MGVFRWWVCRTDETGQPEAVVGIVDIDEDPFYTRRVTWFVDDTAADLSHPDLAALPENVGPITRVGDGCWLGLVPADENTTDFELVAASAVGD